jgi:hypothetical protein
MEEGRGIESALLFGVFGTRTAVLQITIPWNLLKTSSSSYPIPYPAQSISLCLTYQYSRIDILAVSDKYSFSLEMKWKENILPLSKFNCRLSLPKILRLQVPNITHNSPRRHQPNQVHCKRLPEIFLKVITRNIEGKHG